MIADYLARKNLSQAEFARRVGVSEGLVWQWINGRTAITAEKAVAIERATEGELSREALRPDVFGEPPRTASPEIRPN